MNRKTYATPFSQYIFKDSNSFYYVRIGPKIYSAQLKLDYTPNFDSEFFGGKQAPAFDWEKIMVRNSMEEIPRKITKAELEKSWFKPEFKKVINYQRAIERNIRNSQISHYSSNQRINYKNNNF
ncbi:hypothetical protein DZC41_12140 [Acinetobacter haemolyticus]|uniref:hypothetical protein n=1 Tax=Acinetobacter haemolyticus TaxID=29430 RepID=UPI0013875758|nr:hypothetical protein [Acinetobacter haemolyticus]NCU24192.1 hypothetical protein [Acinetobacter haemolyticus]